uniref:MARVEL domain-containing protein n=1 Tax=Plectus sambesii TaxID=2011161 RepID=A0A914XI13_9BILA
MLLFRLKLGVVDLEWYSVRMVAFDAPFPSKWPFGILMTAQWVLSFALLLALWSLDFQWAGTGLVYYTAWMTFGMGLFSWIAHLFGLQKSYQVGKIYFHIPFAATDFVNSVILFPLYALSTLLCVYFIFYSLRYVGNMSVVYAFAAASFFLLYHLHFLFPHFAAPLLQR